MIFHAIKGYVLTASMAVNCCAQQKGSIDNMSALPLANSSVTGLMSVSLAWFKFDATGKLNVRKSRSEKMLYSDKQGFKKFMSLQGILMVAVRIYFPDGENIQLSQLLTGDESMTFWAQLIKMH